MTAKEDAMERTVEPSSARRTLQELVEPLRRQREQIVERLAELAAESAALRVDLADVDAVLKRLDPSSLPAPAKKRRDTNGKVPRGQAERMRALRRVLDERPELLAGGFTMSEMVRHLREHTGYATSTHTLAPLFEELRDAGLIRADRVTRGGGMSYLLVGANGG